MKRLDFVKQSSFLIAGMAFAKPFNIIHRINNAGPVIGHGDFKYRVNYNWGNLGASHPVKDCHEMVMDKKKRIFLITNEVKNNIIIYDRSGKLLDSWGHQFPGGHGLTIHDEGGEEFLYITDHELGRFTRQPWMAGSC